MILCNRDLYRDQMGHDFSIGFSLDIELQNQPIDCLEVESRWNIKHQLVRRVILGYNPGNIMVFMLLRPRSAAFKPFCEMLLRHMCSTKKPSTDGLLFKSAKRAN